MTSAVINYVRRNAVAFLALFVALGGTSYAAFNLPAHSVGTRQLRNGAVTNRKLAKHSVNAVNFNPKSIAGHVAAWVQVGPNDQLIAARPAASISASNGEQGDVRVVWQARLSSACFTLVSPTNVLPSTPASAYGVGPFRGGGAYEEDVFTFNSAGGVAPEPFNAVVVCPELMRKIAIRHVVVGLCLCMVVFGSTPNDQALANSETVQACGPYPNRVFAASPNVGVAMTSSQQCPILPNGPQYGFVINSYDAQAGNAVRWEADAPGGLQIVGATASGIYSTGMNSVKGDYGGGFYWVGGGGRMTPQTPRSVGFAFKSPSRYFGEQMICGKATCSVGQLDVSAVSLYVQESHGPSFTAPVGLWSAQGWTRGVWPFFAWGDSPSGLCSLSATLGGQAIATVTSAADVSQWHQCAAQPINQPLNTALYGNGALPLTLSATDATSVDGSETKTIYVDNTVPTISLAGPSDAPSTAGTQYVTATAGGSPSGIEGISCTLDGGPAQWYAAQTAQVPVGGIGEHTIACSAANNAVDPAGHHGWSDTATWSVKIGEPTALDINLSPPRPLTCHRVRIRIWIPSRWIRIHWHGRTVRVRTRPTRRTDWATRCHVPTVRRRAVVWVTIRRHGHLVRVRQVRVVRVVVAPGAHRTKSKRVPFGRATTVSGWLGTSSGTALGGATVTILAAPDNGLRRFRRIATSVTRPDGAWMTKLPPGPSRIVEAVFAGGATTEAARSTPGRVVVPARVRLLRVVPHRVPWGGTITITGQLLGGHLPRGGALARLRIGTGRSYSTYGIQEHVTGRGRFTTSYTFGAGYPGIVRSYWFQVATLPMGNYPYAPSSSGRQYVLVGGR